MSINYVDVFWRSDTTMLHNNRTEQDLYMDSERVLDYFPYFLFPPLGGLLKLLEHNADFSVSWSFKDGRTPWTGDQLVARPLPRHGTTQTQKNAHTHQTSMSWVGFERTIPASERAKTVYALDRSATVTGDYFPYSEKIKGGLWDPPTLCMSVSPSPFQFLTNISEETSAPTTSAPSSLKTKMSRSPKTWVTIYRTDITPQKSALLTFTLWGTHISRE
jgi:hypothetical protein